jgi:hypothetical protein
MAASPVMPVIRVRPLGGRSKEVVQITPEGVSVKQMRGAIPEDGLAASDPHIPVGSIRRVLRTRVGYPSERSFWVCYAVEGARRRQTFRTPESEAPNVDRALDRFVQPQPDLEARRLPTAVERGLILAGLASFALAFAAICLSPGGRALSLAGAITRPAFTFIALGLMVAVYMALRDWYVRLWRRGAAARELSDPKRRRRGRAGRRPLHSAVLGWLVKLAGVAWVVMVLRSDWADQFLLPLYATKNYQLIQYAVYALYLPGFGLLYLGYRLCLRPFEPHRHADSRPPIMYLRGFGDDGRGTFQPTTLLARMHGIEPTWGERDKSVWTTPRKIPFRLVHPGKLLRMFLNADRHSAEEALAAAFRRWGPFLAVGQPGEWLATPGAERMYVADETWQRTVLDYLARCQAVVLQPSRSEGIRWEVEQVFRHVPRHRILLSLMNFRDRPNDYEDFRAWLEERWGLRLPLSVPFLGEACFVYFEADGTPRLQRVCLTSPLLWSFTGNAVDALRTFHAFLQGLSGAPRDPPRQPKRRPLQAAVSALIPAAYFLCLAFPSYVYESVRGVVRTGAHQALRSEKSSEPPARAACLARRPSPGVGKCAMSEPPRGRPPAVAHLLPAGQGRELPRRLGCVAREVVVDERDHRHPLPKDADGPSVLDDLFAAVDDDVVQGRRQGVHGRAVAQQPQVGERPRHHVEPLHDAQRARHPCLVGHHPQGVGSARPLFALT